MPAHNLVQVQCNSPKEITPEKSLPNVMSSQSSGLESINRHFVSSILISNVMSLVPKVDELALVVGNHNPDIICITETWLKSKYRMMSSKFIITLCYDEIGKKENMVEFVCI